MDAVEEGVNVADALVPGEEFLWWSSQVGVFVKAAMGIRDVRRRKWGITRTGLLPASLRAPLWTKR